MRYPTALERYQPLQRPREAVPASTYNQSSIEDAARRHPNPSEGINLEKIRAELSRKNSTAAIAVSDFVVAKKNNALYMLHMYAFIYVE
ncbi:hypothetical protein SLA2020_423090 [Shorea laevis]